MRIRAALAILVAVPLLTTSAAEAESRRVDRLEQLALEGINTMRAENGLPRLMRSASLSRSASRYARLMAGRGFFGHLSTVWASQSYSSLGEIILVHPGKPGRPRVTVNRWASSSAHRSVMLSAKYRQVGVGKAYGSYGGRRVTMWVAHLGRR